MEFRRKIRVLCDDGEKTFPKRIFPTILHVMKLFRDMGNEELDFATTVIYGASSMGADILMFYSKEKTVAVQAGAEGWASMDSERFRKMRRAIQVMKDSVDAEHYKAGVRVLAWSMPETQEMAEKRDAVVKVVCSVQRVILMLRNNDEIRSLLHEAGIMESATGFVQHMDETSCMVTAQILRGDRSKAMEAFAEGAEKMAACNDKNLAREVLLGTLMLADIKPEIRMGMDEKKFTAVVNFCDSTIKHFID